MTCEEQRAATRTPVREYRHLDERNIAVVACVRWVLAVHDVKLAQLSRGSDASCLRQEIFEHLKMAIADRTIDRVQIQEGINERVDFERGYPRV